LREFKRSSVFKSHLNTGETFYVQTNNFLKKQLVAYLNSFVFRFGHRFFLRLNRSFWLNLIIGNTCCSSDLWSEKTAFIFVRASTLGEVLVRLPNTTPCTKLSATDTSGSWKMGPRCPYILHRHQRRFLINLSNTCWMVAKQKVFCLN
jgi:hypothetical protein